MIKPPLSLAALALFASSALFAQTDPPLYQGLGKHVRPVKACSSKAQPYFNQGLAFLYAFNHDEAIRSFRKATELDSRCAMAHWGIAAANGPHINFPMVPDARAAEARKSATLAREMMGPETTEADRALILAQDKRFAYPQPADRRPLDEAYAEAMRQAWKKFPKDADVGALFAESMMDLRPWDLWTQDGKPQPGTEEIVRTLEEVLAFAPSHPMANHLYIHAVEASPDPGKARAAAERMRSMQPGLGHMVHMPTHIDVRLGNWEKAIRSNALAIEADRKYREKRKSIDFYQVYMAHNRHMLTFAAMMTGQSKLALKTIREMVDTIPADWRKANAPIADGFIGMPFEVMLRFGKWNDILAEAELPESFPLARALRRYARGVSFAALGKVDQAREEQRAFLEAKGKVPQDAAFGNNQAKDLLAVAENFLEGEILFREGKLDESVARLREAARSEDQLRYDEPPDWIQPVRHALGAVLLKAGRAQEAEAVYRDDLKRLPENVWSLQGLADSLRVQKKMAEAKDVEGRLKKAGRKADLGVKSSCLCITGA